MIFCPSASPSSPLRHILSHPAERPAGFFCLSFEKKLLNLGTSKERETERQFCVAGYEMEVKKKKQTLVIITDPDK